MQITLPTALFVLAICATPTFATEFHVSSGKGSDAGDGSADHPWKTILAAANVAMPGDTITVHAGNNLLAGKANLSCHAATTLPCSYGGNVFTKGTDRSKFDQEFLSKPEFDTGANLIQKADGWYLNLKTDAAWAIERKRKLVTNALLGKAVIPNQAFENLDGSPIAIDTDYFGNKRDSQNLFPGPFETPVNGEIKVWPKH